MHEELTVNEPSPPSVYDVIRFKATVVRDRDEVR
jgi:hypothetical protein